MGCLFSRRPESPPTTATTKLPPRAATSNFGKPTGLNRADYIAHKLAPGAFVCKTAGSIQGQQFVVEDCAGATVLLLDHIAQLTVDSCTDTAVVTGPVEGSIFIRDCTNCVFVVACQQLRLRNCTDCKVFLCSTTGPIIESSSDVGLSCYPLAYFELAGQFERAGLDPFQNAWQVVFDFTPTATKNYHCLPLDGGAACVDLPALLRLDRALPNAADRAALVAQGYTFLDSSSNDEPTSYAVPYSHGLMAGLVDADVKANGGRRCALVLAPAAARDDVRRRLDQCSALFRPNPNAPYYSAANHLLLVRSGVASVAPGRLAMLTAPLPLSDVASAAGADCAKAIQQSSRVIALQFLLPSGSSHHPTASIADLLGVGKTFYWCQGSKVVAERAKMLMEDWVEKT